ncbi:hypothetical protein SteCoe_15157 [Stentor coeruleus]|uniref:Uncharacterized protein n=1 Tax=Stentor coeruleus TaxID=5963 RepID=A0A1R2C497_9CILI|nr:hypothetical protein SteCoe_15157 [Stentor coeruleus]
MSRASKSPSSPKKPDFKPETPPPPKISEKEQKLLDLADTIKKNQESISTLRLELSDKDRIIKEILEKLESLKVRRPPIRPPHFYERSKDDNPYIDDDLEYWQVNSVKPQPLPRTWVGKLEKEEPQIATASDISKSVKLPQIMSKQSRYRSQPSNKSTTVMKYN